VRSAVLKSLNIIAYHSPNTLKPYVNDKLLLDNLANALAFDPKTVEEVTMGSVAEKIDRGKPLRLDAFSLLDTLVKKIISNDEPLSVYIPVNTESDISADVQIRRLVMIRELLESHPNLMYPYAD
jgi:hypothetical protein